MDITAYIEPKNLKEMQLIAERLGLSFDIKPQIRGEENFRVRISGNVDAINKLAPYERFRDSRILLTPRDLSYAVVH